MTAKEEMKALRNYVRAQMKLLRNDPFLADVAPYVEVRFLRWDARNHGVVLVFRDTRYPQTKWDSRGTRYEYIHTWGGRNFYYRVWANLNKLVCDMRYPE